MRAFFAVSMLLAVAPPATFACSCMGTTSIGAALLGAESVVIGRVENRAPRDGWLSPFDSEPLIVNVERSLKGDLKGRIRISSMVMCYRSFSLEDFKVGQTYVFPLDSIDMEVVVGWPIEDRQAMERAAGRLDPADHVFLIPSCSHSGLALVGTKLYTNELTADGGRRLEYFMGRSLFEFLAAIGIFDVKRLLSNSALVVLLLLVALILRRRARRMASNTSLERTRGE